MKQLDYNSIEKVFFKGTNSLNKLLSASMELFEAQESGILFGTNHTQIRFLPTHTWDRGVMDRFAGRGFRGLVLKFLGKRIVTAKGLSPIMLQKKDESGCLVDNDGMIAYVLRNYASYYKKGISVIICTQTEKYLNQTAKPFAEIPFYVFDGRQISKSEESVRVNINIVKHFNSKNAIYIYIPDYGILVVNTADEELLKIENKRFVHEAEVIRRANILMDMVEASSLAYLGQLKGSKGAQLLWRKEKHLRQISQDLIQNVRRYRDLYENAPIAYISLAPDGVILKCNQKAEELSGYTASELIGMDAKAFFADDPQFRQGADMIFGNLVKHREVKDKELRIKVKNGQFLWVSLSVDSVKNSKGRIVELRMTVMDISKRKLLENKLIQSRKMEAIGTLAGGVAHDFNNILSPIAGYTEMLLMDGQASEKEKNHFQTILESVNHAKELVGQILTFGLRKTHEMIALDSSRAVADTMTLVRSVLPATIRLETHVPKGCHTIKADPIQLRQLIMNLVTNAYQFMKNNNERCLTISLENVKHPSSETSGASPGVAYVRLSVSDTGRGIKKEVLDRIFDPYFSTKDQGEGAGIGLSVVHGIVESHGGYIKVKTQEGKGTRFDVYLPQSRDTGLHDPLPAEEDTIEKGRERVLLVDDDSKVALMQTHMLEKLGYSVTCFTSSTNAVKVIKSNPNLFDLIITDVTMPGITGLQLADLIYRIKPELPVILCTGLGDTLDRKECERPSIKGLLKKPVAIRELSRVMRSALCTP